MAWCVAAVEPPDGAERPPSGGRHFFLMVGGTVAPRRPAVWHVLEGFKAIIRFEPFVAGLRRRAGGGQPGGMMRCGVVATGRRGATVPYLTRRWPDLTKCHSSSGCHSLRSFAAGS